PAASMISRIGSWDRITSCALRRRTHRTNPLPRFRPLWRISSDQAHCASRTIWSSIAEAQKANPPALVSTGGLQSKSLTMTYFHTGIRTIIGAKAFHCPVRDGKEWGHLAMVVRHNGLPG